METWIRGAAGIAIAGALMAPAAADGEGERAFAVERAAEDAAVAAEIEAVLAAGVERVEAFFGRPFERPFTVTVAPDRAAFDAWFPAAWGMGATQCWMVASGVDSGMAVLSPRVWREQACEHDPDDAAHLANLLVHELVHTYHGQRHPSGDFAFDGAETIGWFLEGLATYASGQLDEGHLAEAAEALATGEGPEALATAWSGTYRYGVSGSLVRYVDETWGRQALVDLLTASSQEEILGRLAVTEEELLERWRAWVAG